MSEAEQYGGHPVTNICNLQFTLVPLAEAGTPLLGANDLIQRMGRYQAQEGAGLVRDIRGASTFRLRGHLAGLDRHARPKVEPCRG